MPCGVVIGILSLDNAYPLDHRGSKTIMGRGACVGSQSGPSSPQIPWGRPPRFPRHSLTSARSGVCPETKHSSPAAQGVVLIPMARGAPGVRLYLQQQQQEEEQQGGVTYINHEEQSGARFCTEWAVE